MGAVDAETMRELAYWLESAPFRAWEARVSWDSRNLAQLRTALRAASLGVVAALADADLRAAFSDALKLVTRRHALAEAAPVLRFAEDQRQTIQKAVDEARSALTFLRQMLSISDAFVTVEDLPSLLPQIAILEARLGRLEPKALGIGSVDRLVENYRAKLATSEPIDPEVHAAEMRENAADIARAEKLLAECHEKMRPKRGRPSAPDIEPEVYDRLVNAGATKGEATEALKLHPNTLRNRRTRKG